MKKRLKIFLIHFVIMSIYILGIWIYGAVKKEFNPVGEGVGIVFLVFIQTIITFLFCLYFVFKSEGDTTDFKNIGLNILAIVVSFLFYLEIEQLWLRIKTIF